MFVLEHSVVEILYHEDKKIAGEVIGKMSLDEDTSIMIIKNKKGYFGINIGTIINMEIKEFSGTKSKEYSGIEIC